MSGAPSGVIAGGWEYVWSAYGLSAAILLGYAVSIYVRYRSERARQKRQQSKS